MTTFTEDPTEIKNLLSSHSSSLSEEEKIEKITKSFTEILQTLGLDLSHPSLEKTPKRVAKMYVQELFSGLNPLSFPSSCLFDKPSEQSEPILIKNITMNSICEHHFLPMIGMGHIFYLPQKKIIGLSKLNRIAQFFCKRPQLQERLTHQIAESLVNTLQTPDVAVFIEMKHLCVSMRGISDESSITSTQVLLGKFNTPSFRQECLEKLRLSSL